MECKEEKFKTEIAASLKGLKESPGPKMVYVPLLFYKNAGSRKALRKKMKNTAGPEGQSEPCPLGVNINPYSMTHLPWLNIIGPGNQTWLI